MSHKTSMRVWQHSTTRGAMRCLMLAIADLANDDGVAWPGTVHLAEKINETPGYTDTIIKKCIEAGELVKISGRGRGHVTRFAVLCGLDATAVKRLKGALQNPYSRAPFSEKGDGSAPLSEKRGTTKGVLQSEKRGTFRVAKQSRSEAVERDEMPIAKNDTHHDPGGDHESPPPTPSTDAIRSGGDGDEWIFWLIDQKMGASSAQLFKDFDPIVGKADFQYSVGDARGKERDNLIGRLVKRWAARGAPTPPPPPPANGHHPTIEPMKRIDDALSPTEFARRVTALRNNDNA